MNSPPAELLAQFALHKSYGDRSLQSDALMVINGFEYLTILLSNFSWPVFNTAGEVEIWLPGGQKAWGRQQNETALQGSVIMQETASGIAIDAIAALNRQGTFDAVLYEGTPAAFARGCKIRDAFMKFEPAERDFANRGQTTQYNGTIFYHFFGELIAGNIG